MQGIEQMELVSCPVEKTPMNQKINPLKEVMSVPEKLTPYSAYMLKVKKVKNHDFYMHMH